MNRNSPKARRSVMRRWASRVGVALCLVGVVLPVHALKMSETVSKPLSLAEQRRLAMRPEAVQAPVVTAQERKLRDRTKPVRLKSSAAMVVDESSGEILVAKNADEIMPVASLTKLMTALVVVESKLSMSELLDISQADVDTQKNTYSRLKVGTRLTRGEMLLLALMSSENRAAMALSRHYPGGRSAFLEAMNSKARRLGMNSSHFADAAGLSDRSVSTARDLHRLLNAAYSHPIIREYSTREKGSVTAQSRRLEFVNSNHLVRYNRDWDIRLQKTGFTNEAGRCLVMEARVEGRRLSMVFLDSAGKLTRYADAARVRQLVAGPNSAPKSAKAASKPRRKTLKTASRKSSRG